MKFIALLFLSLSLSCGSGGGASPDPGPADVPSPPDSANDLAPDPSIDPGAPDLSGPDLAPEPGPDLVPDPGTDTVDWPSLYGTGCEPNQRVCHFEIVHSKFPASIGGWIADRVDANSMLEPKESEGPCRLMMDRVKPFCEPPCNAGEQCRPDGKCQPFPAPKEAGTVTITGLVAPVTMVPNAGKQYAETGLGMKAFEALAHVELVAKGGEVAGFALQGTGVPDLKVANPNWVLAQDKPMEIAWTPEPGPWKIRFTVNVNVHGDTPVILMCDVDDTGSYSVPASLVNAQLAYGVTPDPEARIARRTVDSAQITEGCVELEVASKVIGHVKVP